jgi:hypothetical protein
MCQHRPGAMLFRCGQSCVKKILFQLACGTKWRHCFGFNGVMASVAKMCPCYYFYEAVESAFITIYTRKSLRETAFITIYTRKSLRETANFLLNLANDCSIGDLGALESLISLLVSKAEILFFLLQNYII